MDTNKNQEISEDDVPIVLTDIDGIGETYAKALSKIPIRELADLAKYSPDSLSEAFDKVGVKVSVKRIKNQDWIGQAMKGLGQPDNNGHRLPEEEGETPQEPEESQTQSTWQQHAEFSVFFDYETDKNGKQVWQTRVWQTRAYHNESGEEELFSGVGPSPWVNWILEKAKLLDVAQLAPTEPEIAASPEMTTATPEEARIEIIKVQTFEIESSPGIPEKRLIAEIHFRVSGAKAETLTTDRIPFHVEVRALNLKSKVTNLVASGQGHLEPQTFKYTTQQEFPMPEMGRFEIHSRVFLIQPGEMMAPHQGPTFKVKP